MDEAFGHQSSFYLQNRILAFVVVACSTDNVCIVAVHNCTERRRSACLVFEMPQDVEVEDVTSAELWLYKYRSDGLGKQVFVVSEVSRGSSRHGKAAVATTLHERRVTNQRGWVKFNMRSVVRHWMKTTRRDDGVVQVTCRTCRKLRHHRQSAPIEINGENRPIIVINIGARRQRTKRSSSDCRFGCCMEHFYVNFTEIGWNDWIIQPKGYVANHCTGSCTGESYVYDSLLQMGFSTYSFNGRLINRSIDLLINPSID